MPLYKNKIYHIRKLIKEISKEDNENSRELIIEILNEKLQNLELESKKAHTLSERKLVTILFADISGFTAMSEELDPEQVKNLLNNCFDVLVPVIEKHGGYIDKFIGDEIMALFGAPIATEKAISSSLMASLEMMDALAKFNERNSIKLGMHIGINSGLVVTGGLGAKGNLFYTVIGDAVNLAARLEGVAQNGQILIGEETYLKTQNEFEFKALEKIIVKGKKELVQPYLLLAKKAIKGLPIKSNYQTNKFYGRKKELNILKLFCERISSQNNQSVLFIDGEAGIGKSELLFYFFQKENHKKDVIYLKAFSFQKTHNYALVADLLITLLELNNKQDGESLKEQLREKLPQIDDESLEEIYIYLATLLNIKLETHEQSYLAKQNTDLAKSIIEKSIYLLLKQFSYTKNVFLIIEDIRYLDISSFELLKFLLKQKFTNNISIILTDSNKDLIKTLFPKDYLLESIHLGPLDNLSSKRIINQNMKEFYLENNIIETLLKNANGNPLYLKEIVFDYSNINKTNIAFTESFRKTSTNLQNLLIAKIDHLPIVQKEVVQIAAVMGNEFSEQFLYKLIKDTGISSKEILFAINLLIEQNILHKSGLGKIQFTSNIYADVAYQNLLKSNRKIHHTNYANLLINESKNFNFSIEIANHLELSTKPQLAIPYLETAIGQSIQTGSNIQANNFIKRLLQLLSKDAKLTVFELKKYQDLRDKYIEILANINVKLGNIEFAVSGYNEIIERNAKADLILNAHLYKQIAFAYKNVRNGPLIQSNAEKAISLLNKVKNKNTNTWNLTWIDATILLLWGYYFSQDQQNLNAIVERENAFIENHGSHTQKVDWYFATVGAKLLQHRFYNIPQLTIEITEKGLQEAIYSKDKMLMVMKYCETGFAHTWSKKPQKAINYFLSSIQLASDCYFIEPWITSLNYLGYLFRKNQDVKQLNKYIRSAVLLAKKTNSHYICSILGSLLSLQNFKNQQKAAQETIKLIERHKNLLPPNYPLKFMWEGPQFEYEFRTNNYEKANECLKLCLTQGQKVWPENFTALLNQTLLKWEEKNIEEFKYNCKLIFKVNQSMKLGFC